MSPMKPRRLQLGSLQCVVFGGPDGDGRGTGPVIVLCHGFGAPGEDLVSFGEVLRLPSDVRWVFPAAPLELEMGYGGDSRAWWMIDMARLDRELRAGRGASLTKDEPDGLPAARDALLSVLAAIPDALGAPSKLILGGFSQGAMLSCDVALSTAVPLAGLVLLSGTVVGEPRWRAAARTGARKGLPVFQSHGTYDPVLPFAGAELLRDLLIEGGASVKFTRFDGQHEIPPPALRDLQKFLVERIG